MGITGDDVEAIMKTLQLDIGFVHQYMDVAYKTTDPLHAEFWLNHCGALVDAEPDADRVARVLALHPAIPPGYETRVEEPDSVTMMRIGIVSNWSFDPER